MASRTLPRDGDGTDYAPVHATLAEIADVAGDGAAARVFYQRALALMPAHGATVLLLGNQTQLNGDLSDAERLYRQCFSSMPSDRVAWTNLAATYLKQHRPADALEALDQVISRAPGDVRAHAYRTSALQALGRQDEVERIVGHGTLVRRQALSPPPAWPGLAAFNADLIAEMRDHPHFSGEVDPMRRAIRGGAVVRFLTTSRTPAVVAFESMLVNAIDAYVAGLSADAAHPHLRSIPKGYTLDVWGNFLGDEGHQAGHIHNVGWLSGVYYAAVPDSVHSDDTERQGWLEFDRPGYGIPYDGDEPLKGRLSGGRPPDAVPILCLAPDDPLSRWWGAGSASPSTSIQRLRWRGGPQNERLVRRRSRFPGPGRAVGIGGPVAARGKSGRGCGCLRCLRQGSAECRKLRTISVWPSGQPVDPGEAIAAFRRAISARPDYGAAFRNLARAARDVGDTIRAIDAAATALDLLPDDGAVVADLVDALIAHPFDRAAPAARRSLITLVGRGGCGHPEAGADHCPVLVVAARNPQG